MSPWRWFASAPLHVHRETFKRRASQSGGMDRPLTHDQALLRVAMLVARADGIEDAKEYATVSKILGERLGHLGDPELEAVVSDAFRDVTALPPEQTLVRVRSALPERAARIQALHVACQVAIADNRLAWQESRQMLDFAQALGLTRGDLSDVLHTYWPPRPPRKG